MKRLISICIILIILISGSMPISSYAAWKLFSNEKYEAYHFEKTFTISDSGRRYRSSDSFYFDFTNNVLVRSYSQTSNYKDSSFIQVFAMKPVGDKLYAYNEDGELQYIFKNIDKADIKARAEAQGHKMPNIDGIYIDIYQYSTSNKQMINKYSSFDVKYQPPKGLSDEFYDMYPDPSMISDFIKK